MTRKKIYILLPVHNRINTTSKFVECLKNQTWQRYHLVLIDDGSTDGTAEWVKKNIENVTVLKGTGNWWWGGSLQQGYMWLKGQQSDPNDLVLIINDDTEFEPDFLAKALSILNQKNNVLLLAYCFSLQSQKLLDSGVYVDWRNFTFNRAETAENINCLSTRGLFMRVADLFDIGEFYPKLLPHYASDYEYTIRAHRKGKQLLTDENLKLWVDEGTTGIRNLDKLGFFDYIRTVFSIRAVSNPIVLSMFIVLACPWQWKLRNLSRIWLSFMANIVRRCKRVINKRSV